MLEERCCIEEKKQNNCNILGLKKALIITYYWPPAGGPGVQRWLKFAKYLPDFGWEPIIFTPENPSYPIIDESLLEEVPEDLEVIKTKIWEPYQWAEKINRQNKKFKAGQFDVAKKQSWISKLSIWIRGNFFIPDARVFWVEPSIKYLKKYLVENKIDVLITTGPPHSLHLIGLGAKKIFPSLKWVADFRDPWTEISYYKHLKLTKYSDRKHKLLEKRVLCEADIVLATSFTDAENFRNKGASAVCITNGFDNEVIKDNRKTKKFTLSYIGMLEQLRNPSNLWLILNQLIIENQTFRDNFILKLVGKVDDDILKNINNTPLKGNVLNLGYLSHNEAIKEMNDSDILLITNFDEEKSKGIIPGKLFEYLATGKKIISFGPKNSDVDRILEETNSGQHFDYQEIESIKSFILEQYYQWLNGSNIISFQREKIQKYSRKSLTEQLVRLITN